MNLRSCTKLVPQPSDEHAHPRDACTYVSAFFLEHPSRTATFGLQQTNFRLHNLYFLKYHAAYFGRQVPVFKRNLLLLLQSKVPTLTWQWRQQIFLHRWYLSTNIQWIEY